MRLRFQLYDKVIPNLSSSTLLHIIVITSAQSVLKRRSPYTFLQCLLQSCICNSEVIPSTLSKLLVLLSNIPAYINGICCLSVDNPS